MSWDAELYVTVDGNRLDVFCQNYTHNVASMARAALDSIGVEVMGGPWYDLLNEMTAPEGAYFLDSLIQALEWKPDVYREMNPVNGWGSYDGFLEALRGMRAECDNWPSGKWEVSG